MRQYEDEKIIKLKLFIAIIVIF